MSASLVGSEMCIRDRGSAFRGCSGGHRRCTKGREASSRAPPCEGPLAGAVSYTHLTLPTICSV
eukprot:10255332-Alexandrium_andersonii.AAC.1